MHRMRVHHASKVHVAYYVFVRSFIGQFFILNDIGERRRGTDETERSRADSDVTASKIASCAKIYIDGGLTSCYCGAQGTYIHVFTPRSSGKIIEFSGSRFNCVDGGQPDCTREIAKAACFESVYDDSQEYGKVHDTYWRACRFSGYCDEHHGMGEKESDIAVYGDLFRGMPLPAVHSTWSIRAGD